MNLEDTRVTSFERPKGPAEACLVVIHAPDPSRLGHRFPLGEVEVRIGRDPDNEVVLEDDAASRRHARIRVAGGGHRVIDLGSTNGTWVNDEQVREQALGSGDLLRVGSTVLKYLVGGEMEARYHEELRALALRDGLTGAANKRHLLDVLEREVGRHHRHKRPLSLLIVDLDRFKAVNDALGHLAGDEVLRNLVRIVAPALRREDCFARFGGDEFAVVLPETPLDGARIVAEKVRRRVEEGPFTFEGLVLPVTASVGVAELGAEGQKPEDLIGAADARLFEAKRAGRNRVAP